METSEGRNIKSEHFCCHVAVAVIFIAVVAVIFVAVVAVIFVAVVAVMFVAIVVVVAIAAAVVVVDIVVALFLKDPKYGKVVRE